MGVRLPRAFRAALRLGFLLILVWGWWVAVAPPTGGSAWFPQADKVKHAAAFAVFAFWACMADLKPRWFWAGMLLAYGVGIEWGQSMVPGRDASWGDVLADAAGIALGVGIAGWLERRAA